MDTTHTTMGTAPVSRSASERLAEDAVIASLGRTMDRRAFVYGTGSLAALVLAMRAGVAFASEGADTPPEGQAAGGPGSEGGVPGEPPEGGAGGPGDADTMTYDYTGTYAGVLVADGESVSSTGESIDAPKADQNAVFAQNAGTAEIEQATITKAGDDTNGDVCNFYGVNSIVLSVGERSAVRLTDSTLDATGEGSNGVFATDGGAAYVTGCSITTAAGNSRGLDATYGGVIEASQVDISTKGDHCAAVATDRGGGTISVSDSTLATAGSGSPLLYSTGHITALDVSGTATGSQITGMEGLNTILIGNSTLESTITGKTASDPVADGVIIYQSTSGDAEAATGETATFQAANSVLKSAITSGALFYCTNTKASIVLAGTSLDFDSSAVELVRVAGNDANNWGQAGSNGAQVTFTGIGQELEGAAVVDTISSLAMYLLEGSEWTGSAHIEANANNSTSDEPLAINIDATSAWIVTDDSTVSALNMAAGGAVIDEQGRTVRIVAGDVEVVAGESALTVTVTGAYGTEVTTSDANVLDEALASGGSSASSSAADAA